jgi:periplasmic protein TonB
MNGGGPGRIPVLASAIVHAGVVAVLILANQAPSLPPMRVYRVSIVSPPPQVAGEPSPAVAAPPKAVAPPKEEPKPAPPRPAPEHKATVKAAPPKPKPKAAPPHETPAKSATAKAQPSRGPNPDARSPGGDNLNVNIEGEEFPFPGYLENIIRQVRRYFRWTGAPGLRAVVYFIIHRDGSVSDIRILTGSGNEAFDFQAQGAVEVAGKRGAFGALPHGFQGDQLPISFWINAQ